MRVAYVCTDPGVPVFGRKGASVHVQALLREHVRRGHEVHLLAVRAGGNAPADLAGVRLHTLPPVPKGELAERERAAQRSDAAVAAVLDTVSPDLVHERYALWGRTATAWCAVHGVPSVLEVNAPLVQEQADHRGLADRARAEQVARDALRAATVVACVSAQVATWARAQGAADPHVVPNGVDPGRVRPGPTRPDGDPFVVGFVGTLKPWHGLDVLLDALALLEPSWRLLLVGDGPQAPALREQAQRLALDVEATGAVDPDDVPALLQRMDVAVAPYPQLDDPYFSPLKLYEYLAAGLPVVASAVGQVPAALQGGRVGVLVPAGDPVALAAALLGLRADGPRRAELRVLAREAVLARHSWSGVLDRLLALLPVMPPVPVPVTEPAAV